MTDHARELGAALGLRPPAPANLLPTISSLTLSPVDWEHIAFSGDFLSDHAAWPRTPDRPASSMRREGQKASGRWCARIGHRALRERSSIPTDSFLTPPTSSTV